MNEAKEKTITLTYDEVSILSCYIRMTTKYREGEAEAWDRLATETEPDGSPKFPKAKSNAQFWRDMEEQLNIIRGKLEG